MLVVDLHALGLVDPLDFGDQVLLDRGATADREHVGRVERAFVQLLADLDLVTVLDVEPGPGREGVGTFLAVGFQHRDRDLLLGLLDRDLAGHFRHLGEALRLARLEQLDHSGQTLGDVLSGHTTGVEGTHGQLGAGLADRLRGDGADRIADLHHEAGGRRNAVAGAANAVLGFALEGGANRDGRLHVALVGLEQFGRIGLADQLVLLEQLTPALGLELLRGQTADHIRVRRVIDEQRHVDELLGLAVVFEDDHVLGDVHQTAGQVTGVGRTEGRVGQALAGTVGRDEVLADRQPFDEVGLDRTLDDLALRIRHQASHAGQLTDLLERTSGT